VFEVRQIPDEDINEATSMCTKRRMEIRLKGFPEKIEKSSKYRSISAPHEAWKIGSPDQPRPLPTEDDVAARVFDPGRHDLELALLGEVHERVHELGSFGRVGEGRDEMSVQLQNPDGKFSTSSGVDWPGSKSSIAKRTPNCVRPTRRSDTSPDKVPCENSKTRSPAGKRLVAMTSSTSLTKPLHANWRAEC